MISWFPAKYNSFLIHLSRQQRDRVTSYICRHNDRVIDQASSDALETPQNDDICRHMALTGYPGDRKNPDDPPNHVVVEDYLRCRGRYEDQADYEVSESGSESDPEVAAAASTPARRRFPAQYCFPCYPILCQQLTYAIEGESGDSEGNAVSPPTNTSTTTTDQRIPLRQQLAQATDVDTEDSSEDEDSSMPPLATPSDDDTGSEIRDID